MMWTVIFCDEFADEFLLLDPGLRVELAAHLRTLEVFGPSLGRPSADTLKGSKFANMKELRFTWQRSPYRYFFAFDPERKAVVLIGGNKAGNARFTIPSLLWLTPALRSICGNWKTNGATRTEEQTMPKTLDEVLAALPQEQQDGVERRARDLIRRVSLRELRKSLGLNQKQLAEALKISQAAVSKQERRQEIQVGTLCEVIQAMGGSLEITARFPGGRTVRLLPGAST